MLFSIHLMMKISKAWKWLKKKKIDNNINKDIINLCRLKEEIDDTSIKDVSNLFRLKKEIDDVTVEDIKNLSRLKKWTN